MTCSKSQRGERRLLQKFAAIEKLIRHSMNLGSVAPGIQHDHCAILWRGPTQVKLMTNEPDGLLVQAVKKP
jgi:hypothetical protein